MNILAINNYLPLKNNNKAKDCKYSTPTYGLVLNKPIPTDTVSFKATTKVANRTWEINIDLARKIHKKLEIPAEKIRKFLLSKFDDLIASDEYPNDPIQLFKLRVKSPTSIKQKTGSRKWKSMEEVIENMTDLIGAKFVIGDPNKRVIDGILDRFIPLIKAKEIELLEIENKRPKAVLEEGHENLGVYDYASIPMLTKMKRIQEETWNGKEKVRRPRTVNANFEDYTDSNYTAIHFLFKIPGEESQVFELQIIGGNVNVAKAKVDDKIWKILDGKDIEKKYNPVVKRLQPLVDETFFAHETPAYAEELVRNAREIFDKYRGEVFLFQRKKAGGQFYKGIKNEFFLPLQYRLFPIEIEQKYGINNADFDFNNLKNLIDECDDKALKAEKNLEKAWEMQRNKK